MDPDEKALHENIITQYRQDADVLRFNLARANAQIAQRDQLIDDLRVMLQDVPDDTCPCLIMAQDPADAKPSTPAPPKPGPPPAR